MIIFNKLILFIYVSTYKSTSFMLYHTISPNSDAEKNKQLYAKIVYFFDASKLIK